MVPEGLAPSLRVLYCPPMYLLEQGQLDKDIRRAFVSHLHTTVDEQEAVIIDRPHYLTLIHGPEDPFFFSRAL